MTAPYKPLDADTVAQAVADVLIVDVAELAGYIVIGIMTDGVKEFASNACCGAHAAELLDEAAEWAEDNPDFCRPHS